MGKASDNVSVGASKGGIIKAINVYKDKGEKVPADLYERLEKVEKLLKSNKGHTEEEGKGMMGDKKAGKAKEKTPKADKVKPGIKRPGDAVEKKAKKVKFEGLDFFTDDLEAKHTKHTWNMLDDVLGFEEEGDAKKAPSAYIATPEQDHTYKETVDMLVVVKLRTGQTVSFEAGQNLSQQSQLFWTRVNLELKAIEARMMEIDRAPRMLDTTRAQVSAALLPTLLSQDGRLRYTDDQERVSQKMYKPFLERIASNANYILANINKFKGEITTERPMTRDRLARDLMNRDYESDTISMRDHYDMMCSQQTLMLGAVEVVRRQLVNHGIAISNLAQKTSTEQWEITAMATELVKMLEKKEQGEVQKVEAPKAGAPEGEVPKAGAPEGEVPKEDAPKTEEESGGAFFNPTTHQFKQELLPIMLKFIKAHHCLCLTCDPAFSEMLESQAEENARQDYERSLNAEVQVKMSDEALAKHREKAETAAYEKFRQELKAEVEATYIAEAKAKYELEWSETKEAAVAKAAVDDYKEKIRNL